MKSAKYTITLLVVVLAFLIVKLILTPFSTPLWWDEAWAYGKSISYLTDNLITFLPNSCPHEISRGHPILFHSFIALGLKLFGKSIVLAHAISFCFAIITLLIIYRFIALFNNTLFSCLLLCIFWVQPIFFTQSGMLLSEISLTGIVFLGFYLFYTKKFLLSLFTASIGLLIKETAIVFQGTIFIAILLSEKNSLIPKSKDKIKQLGKLLSIASIPYLYYVIQYFQFGYIFFPEHLNNFNFSQSIFFDHLKNYCAIIFIYQGRNVLTLLTLFAFIYHTIIKRNPLSPERVKLITLLSVFVIFFLIFSSLNFFSPRYILVATMIYLFISLLIIEYYFKGIKLVAISALIIIAGSVNLFKKKSFNDINVSYTTAAITTKSFIAELENMGIETNEIKYSFLFESYVSDEFLGYVSSRVINSNNSAPRYIAITSADEEFKQYIQSGKVVYKNGDPNFYECCLIELSRQE